MTLSHRRRIALKVLQIIWRRVLAVSVTASIKHTTQCRTGGHLVEFWEGQQEGPKVGQLELAWPRHQVNLVDGSFPNSVAQGA